MHNRWRGGRQRVRWLPSADNHHGPALAGAAATTAEAGEEQTVFVDVADNVRIKVTRDAISERITYHDWDDESN